MKTPITVRIDATLLAEVRRCAGEENRTLTNFIETVLRQKVSKSAPASSSSRKAGSIPAIKRSKDKTPHVA